MTKIFKKNVQIDKCTEFVLANMKVCQ